VPLFFIGSLIVIYLSLNLALQQMLLESRWMAQNVTFDWAGASGPFGTFVLAVVAGIESQAGDFNKGVAAFSINGDVPARTRIAILPQATRGAD
jgi:hypothetical protein